MKDTFDKFDIRVRISVCIILLAPVIIGMFLMLPEIRGIYSTTMIALTAYALCNIFIIITREKSKDILRKCFPDHRMPVQVYLMPFKSEEMDHKLRTPMTRTHYYDFLGKKMKGFQVIEENSYNKDQMRAMADDAYEWLFDRTQNASDFPLIQKENINFSFSYTLLGMKTWGIVISILCMMIPIALHVFEVNEIVPFNNSEIVSVGKEIKEVITESDKTNTITTTTTITNISEASDRVVNYIPTASVGMIFLLIWIFCINKKFVKSAGNKYARTLLDACDSDVLAKLPDVAITNTTPNPSVPGTTPKPGSSLKHNYNIKVLYKKIK
ncbi:MAG: hypothetical protein WBI07_21155 [Mobilitalea sp.]